MELDPNTGIKYIRKNLDEQTKNHQMDTEMINAAMPELPNSDLCPVKTFMDYMSHLQPRCEYLWQHSKNKEDIKDTVWYKPSKIGPNPLSGFMSRVSHDADLSCVYTNHSIRSTATTFLGRANFSAKQIMSITGHHSVNLLAVYQRVSQNEKLQMGLAMNFYLQSDQRQAVTQRDQPRPIAPKMPVIPHAVGAPPQNNNENNVQTGKEIVAYEPEDPLLAAEFKEDLNFDVETFLSDIEKESVSMTQIETANLTSTTVQRQTYKRSPNIPIFNNCKIGKIENLHIHVHKN